MRRPRPAPRRSMTLAATCATLLAAGAGAGAAGAQTVKDEGQLAKCDRPMGTLAVYEPGDEFLQALSQYQLPSPTPLLRLFAQKSGCFRVLERGVAFQAIERERALAAQGQLQANANMGGGQMATADFVLMPSVQFSNPNAGGVGGAVAGLFARRAPVIGAVAGGLKFKEAQTTITLADARTSEQVAVAEGKGKKTDFSLGALGFAGGALVGVGGYTNTAEGKVVAASFLDNYNKLVTDLKANPAIQQRLAAGGASAAAPKAGAVYAEGDVLGPKIDGVKLLATPADGGRVLAALKKTDEVVSAGEEKDGFVKVMGSAGEGWVKKALVGKR